jgi:hypothetical protein
MGLLSVALFAPVPSCLGADATSAGNGDIFFAGKHEATQ